MKIYRHYKNLTYRYINRVIHSETLETLVLYEALYDNPKGRFWVRPEANFFEEIEQQGVRRPRFAPVALDIQSHTEITPELVATILSIAVTCFPVWKADVFAERLKRYTRFHLGLAWLDGRAVGFKFGYAVSDDGFYSWLGGVNPQFQRQGIASALMKNQHEWCLRNGFKTVHTKCMNFNTAMLQLNSCHGFFIIQTERNDQGIKLVLEKTLT